VEEQQGRLIGEKGEGIPVSVSATPLQDRRGNALGLVVVLRDLREIEELRRHMLIQARLAAVGELVAGLAHEINNPLAFVRSNLALLDRHTKAVEDPGAVSDEERSELAQETREIIEESLTGVDRAVEIVRGVRRFTHAGTPDREDANLNELLEDAISMLRPRVHPPEVTITLEPQPLPSVSCAPHELRQVFLNLMVNALDAIGSQGHVVASSRIEGAEAVVEIRDDGCGMDPETIERIFDPFFTTKRVGEGTGLGLGIAWNIVRAQGGQIEVRSKPGEGSSFRVRLPMPENDWLEAD
jgi:signal transduction histidine kinase